MFTVTTFDQWTDKLQNLLDAGIGRTSVALFMVSYIVVSPSRAALQSTVVVNK